VRKSRRPSDEQGIFPKNRLNRKEKRRLMEMKSLIRISVFIILSFVSLFGFQAALAQDFPTKPVTLVIPVGAGGSHDLTARAVTSVDPEYLGQPILVQPNPWRQ
jgi:hypothetical protein